MREPRMHRSGKAAEDAPRGQSLSRAPTGSTRSYTANEGRHRYPTGITQTASPSTTDREKPWDTGMNLWFFTDYARRGLRF
jgi:hypothetical protein